ncbi:MAG: Lrp/AsnC ligand binding domain-containing protein [Candidatus Asgardarchaeia archaeon]
MNNEEEITAIVLISVKTGTEYDVLDEILKNIDVEDAYITYGEWDIVLILKGRKLGEIDVKLTRIRKIKDIDQTSTLLAM